MSAALRIESPSTLARSEADLQARYQGFLAEAEHDSSSPDLLELLDDCALLLELTVLGVFVHELAKELDCRTWEDVSMCDGFYETLSRRVPFDLDDTSRHLLDADELSRVNAEASHGELFPEAAVSMSAASIVESCPIQQLERAAAARGVPERGYRCRVAYDALRAFLARGQDDRLRIVGRVYAEGGMTVDEVASVLKVTTEDAAALLQEHGFVRSLEATRLTEGQRARIFSNMRADRLGRGSEPPPFDEHEARRDAIASSRIEDIDVRPWLRRAR